MYLGYNQDGHVGHARIYLTNLRYRVDIKTVFIWDFDKTTPSMLNLEIWKAIDQNKESCSN
jgi:hypothetical protein